MKADYSVVSPVLYVHDVEANPVARVAIAICAPMGFGRKYGLIRAIFLGVRETGLEFN
jgi:hypothetical protein